MPAAPSVPGLKSLAEPRAQGCAGEVPEVGEALALFQQQDYPAALAKTTSALQKNPDSAAAWVLMGRLAMACRGGFKTAVESFRKALDSRPGDVEIEVLLAEALLSLGRPREAGEALVRALRARPYHLPAMLALARLGEAARKPAEAEALLREAARRHPRAQEAARCLGDFLKRRGRLEEAQRWHWRSFGAPEPEAAVRPRRAVFLVQNGPQWLNLASVHEAFACDPSWEAVVVAMPNLHPYCVTDGERNEIFDHLDKERVPYVRWDQFPLGAGCAEVMFIPTPWEVSRPQGWHTEDLMALGLRLAYIPYCFETGNDDTDHAVQFDQSLHRLAWAVFARSGHHKSLYGRHCSLGNAHVAVTGHPKMDALRRLEEARDPELDAFVAGRRAVCWNPHFNVTPDGTAFGSGYSTFLRWWSFLLGEFERRPGLVLLIRPHPLLLSSLVQRQIWTQAEVDGFLARCASSGNIQVDRRPSYLPVFAASHAMMSDLSTFVLEYPMTGKPLLYLRNPSGSGVEEGILVGDYCDAADTEERILMFLDDVAAGIDPRAAERSKAFGPVMFQPPGGAGAAVKAAIDSRLAKGDFTASVGR